MAKGKGLLNSVTIKTILKKMEQHL